MGEALSAEQLLEDAAWLRRLAQRLAGDGAADDLVQETWLAAWRRRPAADQSLRPWLRKVMRDTFRMHRRALRRRASREASLDEPMDTATPDQLLEQVRLHQQLVELVLALDEPFRSTVLARFVEGRSAVDIARANGISEGTVRWRLHEALQRLRHQLDERHGARKHWAPAVLAFSGGTMGIAKTSKVGAGLVLLLLLLLGCGLLLIHATRHPATTKAGSHVSGTATDSRPPLPAASTGSTSRDNVSRPWWDPAGMPLRNIRGRVITKDGTPIQGARVELRGWANVTADAPEASLETNADGAFVFAPKAGAMYGVIASADGYAPRSVRVDPRAPSGEQHPETIAITLHDCAATVEGIVSDSGGGPIEHATVRFGVGLLAFGAATSTDAGGRYVACVSDDATLLSAGADGYEHVRMAVFPRGKQRMDITLAPEARIIGQLVEEGTGRPVSNAQVFVAGAGDTTTEPRYALTSPDGTFELNGIVAGRVMLRVWAADHFMFDARELNTVAGKTLGPVIVTLPAAATVRGRVVSNGSPLAGASVQFYLPTSRGAVDSLRAVTDVDGAFVAINVGRGKDVRVAVRGVTVRSPATIDTRSGDVQGFSIDVSAPVSLRGHVHRQGKGVAGAKVQVQAATGRMAIVETDAAGHFTAQAPDPGPCSLSATSSSLGAYSTDELEISCDHAQDGLTLTLDGGATLSGVVLDEEGAPVPSAVVMAVRTRGDDLGKAVSGTDGAFQIEWLVGGGSYTFSVASYDGGPPLPWSGAPPATVDLRDGDAAQRGITLAVVHRVATIEGLVVDSTGAPVADAVVRAVSVLGRSTAAGAPPRRTGADGRFSANVAGSGPFRVEAGLGAGPRASVDGVRAGARDVRLQLTGVASLRGTLAELEGASVNVRASDASDPWARSFMANVEGNAFALDDLPPGTYSVLAVGRDGRTAAAMVSLAAGETRGVALTATKSRLLAGSVISFDTGKPTPGVRCRATASLGDLVPPLYWQQGAAVVSDTGGAFAIERAPTGEALVMCDSATGRGSAIARVGDGPVRVLIVEKPGTDRLASPGFSIDSTRVRARVHSVDPQGPAAAAAIASGDVITSVDGTSVQGLSGDAVTILIGRGGSGAIVKIGLDRRGAAFERTLVLGPPEP